MRPRNVGILACEMYFPRTYVSQEDLETFNKVPKGKYTIGLGQLSMSFVEPYEDVNSLTLTAVQNLLFKYKIDPRNIGRLEVGTETLLDKSKSIKTVLMQLFKESGNHDIEGVTSLNACYGGTNALFNTISWIESSSWDGRLGISVTVDIAVYKAGPARPTGGAGAVAMLIGPDAPMVFESIRSTFIDHAYDFYKPDPRSEYPTVDGHVSIGAYLTAIDQCFSTIKKKQLALDQPALKLNDIDFACFHAPFGKMVYKAFLRLFYQDILNGDLKVSDANTFNLIKQKGFDDQTVQKELSKLASQTWQKKVKPSLFIGERLGNIYTGSLYAGLISLISDDKLQLTNKRILMFSYGSGLASSMFLIKVQQNVDFMRNAMNIHQRLANRIKISAEEYDQIMQAREKAFGANNYQVQPNIARLEPGTFYLVSVDKMWRRNYQQKSRQQLEANKLSSQQNYDISDNNSQASSDTGLRLQTLSQQIVDASKKTNNNQKSNPVIQQQRDNDLLWSGFYKKTVMERLDQLKKIDPEIEINQFADGGLSLKRAELMVENCIGKISVPLGLGLNFLVNGKYYTVPMAVEEPSVIAAASSSAKFIAEKGKGFTTQSTLPIMIGQVQMLDCDINQALYKINNNHDNIIKVANQACQEMVSRGGGVVDVRPRVVKYQSSSIGDIKSTGEFKLASDQMLIIDLLINVCESMGANSVNTVTETIAPYLESLTGGRAGIKILSNLCVYRKAMAQFQIPVASMEWKSASGEQVAQRIIESYIFAQMDPFRAATHNKGIMNGIDAVAIATGQDWRSIESSCHSYASFGRPYQPLSHYEIVKDKEGKLIFKGTLEVPIAVGTKGGVIDSNKIYSNSLRILGFPTARQLSEIMVCVGLAQNFAALRALAIEGIQKGHMNLHARNIALSAGIPTHLVQDTVRFMKKRGRIDAQCAKEFLMAYDIFSNVRASREEQQAGLSQQISQTSGKREQLLSTFFVELEIPKLKESVFLHVAFECFSCNNSVLVHHLHIDKNINSQQENNKELLNHIFGEKGYEWLQSIFQALEHVRLDSLEGSARVPSKQLVYKLKLCSILIDLITSQMIKLNREKTIFVLNQIRQQSSSGLHRQIQQQFALTDKDLFSNDDINNPNSIGTRYGLALLCELIRIFHYNLEQSVDSDLLKFNLSKELFEIIDCQIKTHQLWEDVKQQVKSQQAQRQVKFDEFIVVRKKRLCATMMLLIDAINFRSNFFNEETVFIIQELGGICELEMTFIRDLQRWKKENQDEINLYSYWLMLRNSLKLGNEKQIASQFITEMKNKLQISKDKLRPKLDDKTKGLSQLASDQIRNYYNFDESKFLEMKSKL